MSESKKERNEYLCPTGDGPENEGRHLWTLRGVEDMDKMEVTTMYVCEACEMKIPAPTVPAKGANGKTLRNPETGLRVVTAQPAEEAFVDYVMAQNGGLP